MKIMTEFSMFWRSNCSIAAVLLLPVLGYSAETSKLPDRVEFNRDIRPILSDNCFSCHGPDKNTRHADLRLDVEAVSQAVKPTQQKKQAIVAGNPVESELVHRITSSDSDQIMPPVESGKQLNAREIELLKRWIEQGAKYEGHWAFMPIKRPNPEQVRIPQAAAAAAAAPQNAIDLFVQAGLATTGLSLSPAADRRTLIRRLSFDLTGLPPTPEQVNAFVQDTSADAYERVVERLLDSPHYGERLAMWWLDLVRYADTVGYHGDQDVSVSPFRQYIIESFNANKPFDQFTLEQLAGDLLPNPTQSQLIASGYNRLGMMSAEGGGQEKEYLAKYISERVRNASGTWLGVTLGCAECHDHKFDPFTTRDFYRFEAFFADIEEKGIYAGAESNSAWGRSIAVPNRDQAANLMDLDRKIAEQKSVLNTETSELVADQTAWEKTTPIWTVLNPETMNAESGTNLIKQSDGSLLASGTSPPTDNYVVQFKDIPRTITALRLEVMPDESLPKKGPGRASNGNFVLTEFTVHLQISNGEKQQVVLQHPTASFEQTSSAERNPYGKWSIASAIDGDIQGKQLGWAVLKKVGQPQVAVFEVANDINGGEGAKLAISLQQQHDNPQHTIGRFRISASSSPRPIRADQSVPTDINSILAQPSDQRTSDQRQELAAYYRSIAPALEPTRQRLTELEKSRKELDATIPRTLVTVAVPPRMVRVLRRGNWMDESGEIVSPAVPGIFSNSLADERRLTRLDLANWIASPENPLTARVVTNRIWKLMFGAGLSRRVDDLGAQGDWPSHPLLLDHLAGQFIDSGWNIKQLIKTIVMSETYRQTSVANHHLREIDPYNRWLARQGRFRLDAELVRDNVLAISGLLVTKLGGTSVKPYQPPGYWSHLNFPTREWQTGKGDELYRRGLYTHWQRQYLHPSLLAFDAPSREECTADRPRSNTPLQSLVLLNDPTYVEAARAFAEQILRSGGDNDSARLNFAFRRAVSREISPKETVVLLNLLRKHHDDFNSDGAAAKEFLNVGTRPVPADLDKAVLAAWTSVARTILNLHETMTRN